jgi:hypothetical protein
MENRRDVEILIKTLLEQNISLQQEVLALKQEIACLVKANSKYYLLRVLTPNMRS